MWENRAPLLKFKSYADFDPFERSDIFLTDKDITSISLTDAELMDEQLKTLFLNTNGISETQNVEDNILWKLEKSKAGINYFKRTISNNDYSLNMFKGKISVKCELSRVFSVKLTNHVNA